jgi:hypothetical protein
MQQTTVITTDALELMVQFTATVKTLLDAVQQLSDKLAEAQLSTIRPEFYSFEQAAIVTGLAEKTLRKYKNDGLIGGRTPMPPSVDIGGRVLFPAADMTEWGADLPRNVGHKKPGKGKEAA